MKLARKGHQEQKRKVRSVSCKPLLAITPANNRVCSILVDAIDTFPWPFPKRKAFVSARSLAKNGKVFCSPHAHFFDGSITPDGKRDKNILLTFNHSCRQRDQKLR